MLVEQIRYPTKNNLYPQVCRGWWEEQCLILHSLGATGEPTELIDKHGIDSTKQLWDAVSLETVQWLRNLDFGFVELDCLLIHGSSVSVSEELTPDTPPWQILDRLQRVGVNNLFCGRSGKVFDYSLQSANLTSTVTTLDKRQPSQTLTIQDKRLMLNCTSERSIPSTLNCSEIMLRIALDSSSDQSFAFLSKLIPACVRMLCALLLPMP